MQPEPEPSAAASCDLGDRPSPPREPEQGMDVAAVLHRVGRELELKLEHERLQATARELELKRQTTALKALALNMLEHMYTESSFALQILQQAVELGVVSKPEELARLEDEVRKGAARREAQDGRGARSEEPRPPKRRCTRKQQSEEVRAIALCSAARRPGPVHTPCVSVTLLSLVRRRSRVVVCGMWWQLQQSDALSFFHSTTFYNIRGS